MTESSTAQRIANLHLWLQEPYPSSAGDESEENVASQKLYDAGDIVQQLVDRAKLIVAANQLLPLLYHVQKVERDPGNDFQPILENNDPVEINNSDLSLGLLMELSSIANQYYELHGWSPVGPGESAGSVVYQHQGTSQILPAAQVELPDKSWEFRTLSTLSQVLTPSDNREFAASAAAAAAAAVLQNKTESSTEDAVKTQESNDDDASNPSNPAHLQSVAWATLVVYLSPEASRIVEPVELTSSESQLFRERSSKLVAVVDVIEREDIDEEVIKNKGDGADRGQVALKTVRGMVQGVWQGLYHETLCSIDLGTQIGDQLASWPDVSMAGFGMMATGQQQRNCTIAILGLGDGTLASFLHMHCGADIVVYEPSPLVVACATKYFGFKRGNRLSVVLGDPVSQLQDIKYDCVIVNRLDLGVDEYLFSFAETSFKYLNLDNVNATIVLCMGPSLHATRAKVTNSLKVACSANGNNSEPHVCLIRPSSENDHGGVSLAPEEEYVILAMPNTDPSFLDIASWEEKVGLTQVSGAMDVSKALETKVVRIENFLSSHDIKYLHDTVSLFRNSENSAIATEVRGGEEPSPWWYVLHLQSNGFAKQHLDSILRRAEAAVREADKNQGWGLAEGKPLQARVVEFHNVEAGGRGLSDPRHYDQDSVLTIDMMISNPDTDFEGGELCALNGTTNEIEVQTFQQGDASVFVSHRAHCVKPVTKGRRNVLVIEFWRSVQRHCPHRCQQLFGHCAEDPSDDQVVYTESRQLPFHLGSLVTAVGSDQGTETPLLEALWQPSGSQVEEPVIEANSTVVTSTPLTAPKEDAAWALFD